MRAQTLKTHACPHCAGEGKVYDTASTGPALRQMREDAGISQRQMAKRMGVSNSWLSKLEAGEAKPPNARVAQYLAQVLG